MLAIPLLIALAAPADLADIPCADTATAGPVLRELQRKLNAKSGFIEPQNAEAFLKVMNAVEPVTHVLPHEGLLTLTLPNGAGMIFVLLENGAGVCGPITLGPDYMKEALGESS